LDPSFLLLIVTGGLLLMLTLRGRRQRQEQQLLQSRIAPGAEVMTASGLYASVVSLDDTVVVLRTGPGQESRWDRRAVARVLGSPEEVAPKSPGPAEEPTSVEGSGNVTDDGDDTGRGKPS
jgi:preprotein translocase subunit YajC